MTSCGEKRLHVISKTDLLPYSKRRKALFITRNHLKLVREAIRTQPLDRHWNILGEAIEERMKIPVPELPESEGTSPEGIMAYYDVFRGCLNDILIGSFVYLIEKEPRYVSFVLERIKMVLSWRTWVHPAHYPKTIDLVTSNVARTLALACQWLGDDLPVGDSKAISKALDERVFQQYITGMFEETGWWARECTTNWCAVVNGGIGSSLVHFIDDNALLADILNEILKRLSIYLRSFNPDGGWIEGVGYWNYGITYYLYFSEAVEKATRGKVNPAKVRQMKEAGNFPLHSFLPPDRLVNFCDSFSPLHSGLSISLMKLAYEFNNGNLRWLGERVVSLAEKLESPYAFIWYALPSKPEPPSRVPTGKLFKKIQWAVLRSSWDEDATVLATKAGYANPWEHTHLDAGTFILHAFGKPLVIDLGRGQYSIGYFTEKRWKSIHANTHGHNTYIINGKNQLPMKEHSGVITDFVRKKGMKYVRMDISRCYSPDDLEVLVRHFVMLEGPICVILDEIRASRNASIEARCHYEGTAEIIDRQSVDLRNANAGLVIKSCCTSSLDIDKGLHRDLDSPEPATGVFSDKPSGKYLSFRTSATGKTDVMLTVMFPFDAENQSGRPELSTGLEVTGRRIRVSVDYGACHQKLTWSRKGGKNVLDFPF